MSGTLLSTGTILHFTFTFQGLHLTGPSTTKNTAK